MIAPVIITIFIILYSAFIVIFFFVLDLEGTLTMIAISAVMLASVAVSIYVLMERIKEIKSGEEDDIGKY
jgi:amino acid transporter